MKKRKGAEKGASAPSRSKGSSNVDFDAIRELARIAGEFDLAEVEVDGSGRVRVSRRVGGAGAPVFHTSAPSAAPERSPSPVALVPSAPAASAAASDDVLITSPFVGTFYRSPSPEAPAFVDVGQTVRKGQVVCIVEAMKLMNEIEAEADGKLLEVLVKNGAHVEYGQPLFRLAKA